MFDKLNKKNINSYLIINALIIFGDINLEDFFANIKQQNSLNYLPNITH